MRWIVLILVVIVGCLLFFRSPSPPAVPSATAHSSPSPATASSSPANDSSGAGFEDVFFIREPVDVSSTPWNGILNAGTPVRKVGQEGNKVVIETGNGRITVDADKITHDPKLSRQVADTLGRPSSSSVSSTSASAPSSSGSTYVNPLVPPPTGR